MPTPNDPRTGAGPTPRNPALAVPCPWCQAPPRQPCTSPRGRVLKAPHPARYRAADEAVGR